ncbi:MAG: nodulation protein NfeD [Chloroflexota bacterium]
MIKKKTKWILFLVFLLFWSFTAVSTQAQSQEVVILEFEAPITVTTLSYLERGFEEANALNAHAIVVVMDTPGGLIDVTLDIVELFQSSDIPVIIFVGPAGAQAASAGSVITAASHIPVMAPATVIGAASPINGDGSDINETAYRKAVEDLKATMRSLTTDRGEDAVNLAEEMIEDARAVTSEEALEAGFIDFIARDVDEILAEVDGRVIEVNGEEITLETANARQTTIGLSTLEEIFFILSSSGLLSLMFTIGMLAIVFEVRSPSFGISGAIGILFIAIALFGLTRLPINWFGMILIGVAFAFFLTEAFTPTSGPLSIVGGIALLAGILVLFNSQEAPEFVRISIWSAVGITLFVTGIFAYITAKIIQVANKVSTTGVEGLVGQTAISRGDFVSQNGRFSGTILLHGEIWKARSDNEIAKGDDVTVKSINGFTARVSKIENE